MSTALHNKIIWMSWAPVVLMNGWVALWCFLNLSPKVLLDSPMNCSGKYVWGHLNWYITLLFWHMSSLFLRAMSRVHMALFPLKNTCNPKLLQVFLNFPLCPLVYGTNINMFLFLEPVLLMLLCWPLLTVCGLFGLCLWLNFTCSLLRAKGETCMLMLPGDLFA